jgi:hypothetical protein
MGGKPRADQLLVQNDQDRRGLQPGENAAQLLAPLELMPVFDTA